MSQFDTVLKDLFLSSDSLLFRDLTGSGGVREWLDVEFPEIRNPRCDLVAWLTDGRLLHLELQSFNDPQMHWRMPRYYGLLAERFHVEPVQMVL